MHIPGIGRVNKKISMYLGRRSRSGFEKYIHTQAFRDALKKKLRSAMPIPLELVTFTDSTSTSDLLLSVLSFIDSAGLPSGWTIYADDEFPPEQKEMFRPFEFLVFKRWYTNVSQSDRQKYNGKWQF